MVKLENSIELMVNFDCVFFIFQEERERKRRELKERIKEIDDPDKQRKMEAREERRDRKKAAPKMKQLKVKAM